jgi:hypothetical protein
MIRYWLDLPTLGVFLSLIVLYFGVALLLASLVFLSPLRRHLHRLNGVVAPFFGAVAILFALLAGFLGNDISDRNREAFRTVQAEAGALRNIYTLSVASASDMRAIRAALKVYANSVAADEWPAMAELRPSAKTESAYDNLLREISEPSIARDSGAAVHAALLGSALKVGAARSERLALASDHTNDLKWLVVIVLALLTQIAIAVVHLERPGAFIASLAIFSCAVVVVLGVLALQEYPFDGAFQVTSAPIGALNSLAE